MFDYQDSRVVVGGDNPRVAAAVCAAHVGRLKKRTATGRATAEATAEATAAEERG